MRYSLNSSSISRPPAASPTRQDDVETKDGVQITFGSNEADKVAGSKKKGYNPDSDEKVDWLTAREPKMTRVTGWSCHSLDGVKPRTMEDEIYLLRMENTTEEPNL